MFRLKDITSELTAIAIRHIIYTNCLCVIVLFYLIYVLPVEKMKPKGRSRFFWFLVSVLCIIVLIKSHYWKKITVQICFYCCAKRTVKEPMAISRLSLLGEEVIYCH